MTPGLPPWPRAVLFDWDNTLVDSLARIARAMNVARTRFGLAPLALPEIHAQTALNVAELWPQWFGDKAAEAKAVYYETFAATHLEGLVPLPGSRELLEAFRERDVPLGLVSNKRGDLLRREVAHLDWTAFFGEAMVGANDAPRSKPERDPADLALQRLGVSAESGTVWLVGDTWGDVACARASGCLPVLLHAPSEEAARLEVTHSFADCHALRALLCAARS